MHTAKNRNIIKPESNWNIFDSLGRFYRSRELLFQLMHLT